MLETLATAVNEIHMEWIFEHLKTHLFQNYLKKLHLQTLKYHWITENPCQSKRFEIIHLKLLHSSSCLVPGWQSFQKNAFSYTSSILVHIHVEIRKIHFVV